MAKGLLILMLLCAGVAHAHHSRSAFALDELVRVDGTVAEVGWTNPHYYLVVEESSAGTRWTFEGHSIPGLVRNGWAKNSIQVGDTVRVEANPNRTSGVAFGLLINVTRDDGETFYSFRPKRRSPKEVVPSTDFSGTWRLIRSLQANLVSGSGPPSDWSLTESARAQVANFDPTEDPSLNCQPRGLPRMLDWPYAQQWQRTARGINITIEHAVETRQLGTELPEAGEVMGLGRAQIVKDDGTSLVIRSEGFAAKHWGLFQGLDSSGDKALLEHYTLQDAGMKLKLTYTVSDPSALTEPAERTLYYAKVADYDFAPEPPCDIRTARRHLEFE